MTSNPVPDLIRNHDVLAEDYIPVDVPGREPQIAELKFCIKPGLKRQRPLHAWLYGGTGVGKTSVARFVLSRLQEETGVSGAYVNCWERGTLYGVAEKVVHDLRLLRAERSSSVTKLEMFMRQLSKKPFVLVLDEIDKPLPKDLHTILYNLVMVPYLGLVCISNNRQTLVGLEDRVRTRLNPRLVEFRRYTVKDLVFILRQRAELALSPTAWDKELLELIGSEANGNARIAIQTLRNAAILAESSNVNRVTMEHVDKVKDSVRELERVYALRSFTEHHQLLYDIVRERENIVSGELWRTYLMRCEERKVKPISERSFWKYINRLVAVGLLNAEKLREWTTARRFSVATAQ